jgi:hypothetical protein
MVGGNMKESTALQKILLEKILEDKELSQYLPEHTRDGTAIIVGKSIELVDDDKLDRYNISFKIKVIKKDEATETSDASIADEGPKIFSDLIEVSKYLRKNQKPFIFSVDSSVTIIKKNNERAMSLPSEVTHNFNSNGNSYGMGLFDFKGYWSVKPDVGLEMILWPERNLKMLDNKILEFLERKYKYQTSTMHYDNGLSLHNIPLKDTASQAEIHAREDPFIIVRISRENIRNIEEYGARTEKPSIPEFKEGLPYAAGIINSPYYDQMSKFEIDITKKVTPQRTLYPPTKLIRRHIGDERYHELNNGDVIDDLVLMYHQISKDFDMVIIPEKSLELLKENKDTAKEFLEYYSNVEKTIIRVYSNNKPDKNDSKILQFHTPKFVRERGNQVGFYADNWFCVRMKKIQNVNPEE